MHTSGLSYGAFFGCKARYACEKEYADLVRRVDRGEIATLEAFVSALSELPLRFRPGDRWEYSHGLDVVGRVIEVASGKDLARFLHEKIFRPLAMRDTSFTVPQNKASRLAALYKPVEGNDRELRRLDGGASSAWVQDRTCSILSGGGFMGSEFPASDGGCSVGGLVSTLRDYTRFVRMLQCRGRCPTTGARLLKEETVDSMFKNWLVLRSVSTGRGRLKGWDDAGRGWMGWCPLGQVSKTKTPPDVWMGGIAGTFWAIDGTHDLVVVHVSQVAESYDFYGEELWRAARAGCEATADAQQQVDGTEANDTRPLKRRRKAAA